MKNMMSKTSDFSRRMHADWYNLWHSKPLRWVLQLDAWRKRYFHGEGSRGGHKRRLLAMFNMYFAVKGYMWQQYMYRTLAGKPFTAVEIFDSWLAAILGLLILIPIDRKRSRNKEDDYYGWGSLIFSWLMIWNASGWLIESWLWFVPLVLPSPAFFQKFGISTAFMNKMFPYAMNRILFGIAHHV